MAASWERPIQFDFAMGVRLADLSDDISSPGSSASWQPFDPASPYDSEEERALVAVGKLGTTTLSSSSSEAKASMRRRPPIDLDSAALPDDLWDVSLAAKLRRRDKRLRARLQSTACIVQLARRSASSGFLTTKPRGDAQEEGGGGRDEAEVQSGEGLAVGGRKEKLGSMMKKWDAGRHGGGYDLDLAELLL